MPGPPHKNRRYHRGKEALPSPLDSDSEIVKTFYSFRNELDAKHDKYERIVKVGRDITIESKRLIFSLQALCRSPDYENDCQKIANGLQRILSTHFKMISLELEGEDPYQFLRAYSPGLQEYTEAVTLYHYIVNGCLYNWKQLSLDMKFNVKIDGLKSVELETEGKSVVEPDGGTRNLEALIPLSEYVLGVQDLSGELMRFCINNFAAGKIELGFAACNFGKMLYIGMLKLVNIQLKEFWRKQFVFKQSLSKMEFACYMMHVRGSEILRDNLMVAIEEPNQQEEYTDFF